MKGFPPLFQTFGINSFSYAKGTGSFVLLNSIVVDKELEYDEPTYDIRRAKECTACMDAFPPYPSLVQLSQEFSLPKLLEMPDGFYEKTVYSVMDNYIQEKKYFQRDAAITLKIPEIQIIFRLLLVP